MTQAELIPKSSAEKLDLHERTIKIGIRGHIKGAKEMVGYAYLTGNEMLLAKKVVAHGNSDPNAGLKNWAEARFKNTPYRTLTFWMSLAREINLKKATVANFEAIVLKLTKPKLSTTQLNVVADTFAQIMDNRGVTSFMRHARLLRDPKKPVHHPRKPISPEKALAAQKQQAVDLWTSILQELAVARVNTVIHHLENHFLDHALDELVETTSALRTLRAARKGTKP